MLPQSFYLTRGDNQTIRIYKYSHKLKAQLTPVMHEIRVAR